MPFTAYLHLKGMLLEQKKKEKKQILDKDKKIKFNSPESLLQHFKKTLGKEYYSFSLIEIVVSFIFENIKKPFDREDVRSYCGPPKRSKKPVPATIHKHLNLLIENGLIHRPHHGLYKVNEHSINYH